MCPEEQKYDIHFYQLVLSIQSAAWYQLGKTASPFSGKVERDLEQAKHSIDMLEMIQRKTKGNLTDEERRLLDHFLYELRLNYVEEIKKPEPQEPKKEEPAGAESSAGEKPAEHPDSAGADSEQAEKKQASGPADAKQ